MIRSLADELLTLKGHFGVRSMLVHVSMVPNGPHEFEHPKPSRPTKKPIQNKYAGKVGVASDLPCALSASLHARVLHAHGIRGAMEGGSQAAYNNEDQSGGSQSRRAGNPSAVSGEYRVIGVPLTHRL